MMISISFWFSELGKKGSFFSSCGRRFLQVFGGMLGTGFGREEGRKAEYQAPTQGGVGR